MTTRLRIAMLVALLVAATPLTGYAQQWSKLDTPIDTTVLCFLESDGVLLAGTWYGGLYRTSDQGATWTNVIDREVNLKKEAILSMASYGRYLYAAGRFGEINRSTDQGLTWEEILPKEGMVGAYCISVVGDMLYTSSWYGELYRSVDSGSTWEFVRDYNAQPMGGYISLQSYHGYLYSITLSGLYHTLDTGNHYWMRRTSEFIEDQINRFTVAKDYEIGSWYGNQRI